MALSANSPRQKMINMMYLVLMALLALNVSIDVLGAFWSFERTMSSTTSQIENKNLSLYADISSKARNNPVKYGSILENATALCDAADSFFNTLQGYKVEMLRMARVIPRDSDIIPSHIDNIDDLSSTAIAGEFFFPGGDLNEGKGTEFTHLMDSFRRLTSSMTSDTHLLSMIDVDFSTSAVRRGDVTIEWIKERFSAYPLAAALAFISQYQSRIRSTQGELLTQMLSSSTQDALLVPNTLTAMVIPQSTTIMAGSPFKAQVILAAYDNTQSPEVFLSDGQKMPVEDGKGIISIPTSSIGEKNWSGYIRIRTDDGQTKDFPFEGKYDVTAPMAVISPTRMNVLYRGIDNPVSISIPGVSAGAVSLSGPGVRSLGDGKYIIDPSSVQGRTARYTPSARMADGKIQAFPAQEFRIKNVPAPVGQIRGQNNLRINKNTLVQNRIEVSYPDFEFDIPLTVTGFTVKIPGRPSYQVVGDRFSPQAASAITNAPSGSEVVIRDIKYSFDKPSKIPQKEPSPIVITLM